MNLKTTGSFLLLSICISVYMCSCMQSGSATATSARADTTTTKNTITSNAVIQKDSIPITKDTIKKAATAIRKFTKIDARTYSVEIMISNVTEPKSFKKLLEKLPDGYSVDTASLNNPAAHYKPGELKYVWMDNYERNFSVTYILKIPKRKKLIRDYEGYFAYIENNAKVSIAIQSSEQE